MDSKVLIQIGAIVFVAIAFTVAVIDLARRDDPATTAPTPTIGADGARTDPLREKLARCQALGETATRDPDCLAAWADNRRRFLGQPEGR